MARVTDTLSTEDAATDKNSQSVVERIVSSLEEEIVLGALRPRERLLEEDLARRFDAKRHIIRAALAELETMGIVVRQPNRGAAVRDFSPEEVEHIYDVREVLERHAAEIIPLPASPELVAELRSIYLRHAKAIEDGDARAVFRENLEFHRRFFAACGNPYLAEHIDQLASRAHAIRFHAIADLSLVEHARREHEQMLTYLENGEREALVTVVGNHIRPSKEAYLRMTRTMHRF